MSTVVVVDSGVANVGSVVAALERVQAKVTISRDWEVIRQAARVLLPGVGSAVAAMRELDRLGLSERLPTLTQPVLGVCLGMQLMFAGSEEGGVPGSGNRESGIGSAQPGSVDSTDSPFPIPHSPTFQPCLSILPGTVRRLPESLGVRIPHMGWNALIPRRPHALVAGLGERDYAYFVHSFGAAESELTLMACEHGSTFSAVVARANFMGAQFHPERSAAVGARLLDNFLKLDLETLGRC